MRNPQFTLIALLATSVAALTGCAKHSDGELESEYGERSELKMASSVNGYGVLADMFSKAGYKVSKRSDISEGLSVSADAIIYAPDSFAPPLKSTIDWFDQWLAKTDGRTLIYIGRDFDAAPNYWRKIRPQVSPKQQIEVDRRLKEAVEEFNDLRSGIEQHQECEWFSIDSTAPHLNVRTLSGDWDLDNVDVSKTEIELYSRIKPSGDELDADSLLAGNGEKLVFRRYVQAIQKPGWQITDPPSRLIIVANGSFLVNLQLVNKEHRKLAGKLIDEVPKGSRVVFIEADAPSQVRNSRGGGGGPQETAGIFDVFGVWPLSVILIQWIIVLALFCFSRWPIFGPPRDPAPAPASDFSRHIDALAETWEITRDSSYARDRWQYYQQHVRAEPGVVAAKRKR
jgi:hypothetical protein